MKHNYYPDAITVITDKDGKYQCIELKNGDFINVPHRTIAGKYVPAKVELGEIWCPPNHIPLYSEHRGTTYLYKLPKLVYLPD